jgi:hypothetical protein
LNQAIPEYIEEPLPTKWAQYMRHFGMLMQNVSVCNIKTFAVTINGGSIGVEVE